MRQLAWLHAVPVPEQERKRNVAAAGPAPERQSRAEKIAANGGEPLLPLLCDELLYLIGYLWEAGPVTSAGMGPAPLSALEIQAWQRGAGIDLMPWEFLALRKLSRAYCGQLHDAETPDCPPPYGQPATDFDRSIVARKVGDAFKAFARAKR